MEFNTTGNIMTRILVSSALVAFATAFYASAQSGPGSAGDSVLLEFNGAKITQAELELKRPSAMFQARANFYETERKALVDLADEQLLDQQAAKERLTVTQLLDRHVNSTIAKDPSEDALRVYYEGVDTTEPYEAVRDKIIDALRQRRIAKAKAAYLQSLRAEAHIIIRLAPPRAPISMTDVPVRGPERPRITLLEFADYECPYCQQLQPVLSRLETEFRDKLAFAYKDYPLNMHPEAPKAAEAAHCAGAQGKFWEFHDLVFENKQLGVSNLKNDARDLKLDTAAFNTCLDKGQMASLVKDESTEAQTLGLQATPTLFVNGRYVRDITYEGIRGVIAEELSALDNGASRQ